MSEHSPIDQSTEAAIQPHIIYGEGADMGISVNPEAAAQTMRELGVSQDAIRNSAIYIDAKNRLINNGTHYSSRLGRLRFHSVPELQDVKGDIVRISTKVKGIDRTEEQMNRTATHEWEHLAQADRKDNKVSEGHLAINGLLAAGALVGNRLGKSSTTRKIGTALGGLVGYELGYWFAPHERQARLRAGQVRSKAPLVTSHAFRRKT